jgi:hypothetical protein
MKRSPYLRTEINSRPKMHIFNRPDHQHAGAQEDSRMMQARVLDELNRFNKPVEKLEEKPV